MVCDAHDKEQSLNFVPGVGVLGGSLHLSSTSRPYFTSVTTGVCTCIQQGTNEDLSYSYCHTADCAVHACNFLQHHNVKHAHALPIVTSHREGCRLSRQNGIAVSNQTLGGLNWALGGLNWAWTVHKD